MEQKKHIYLIGICGTAMASLAGLLRLRGHRVSGSDAAAYPPMCDLLEELGISMAQPYAAANLEPRPDLVIVGNAISRGNVELEHVLDQRIPFCSLASVIHDEFLVGRELVRRGRNARQDDHDQHAGVDLRVCCEGGPQICAVVSHRRRGRELRLELCPATNATLHPGGG